jgi:hypothetical protein
MSFELPLSEIYNIPCLTNSIREYMLEACLLVLTTSSHDVNKSVLVEIIDNDLESFTLIIDTPKLPANVDDGWDIIDATEKAAECIALIMCSEMTNYHVIKRSRRGTGFDYWIGDKDGLIFQNKARLEISGILKGDRKSVEKRFREKSLQTNPSDNLRLPAYISVTAFDKPMTKFSLKL